MPSSPKILPGPSKVQSEAWLARGGLPPELREGAARRLGVLALLTAATFTLFGLAFAPSEIQQGKRDFAGVGLACLICALVLSLATFVICRKRRDNPRLLLDLGVGYQIAMAAVIGVVDNFPSLAGAWHIRGWSGLAVWIFIFAVFVPSTPRRTLWVSSVVALMDPLTLLVTLGVGVPPPTLAVVPQLFGPTIVAVLTAVVASRINYSLGRKLHEARELGAYRLVELLGKGGMGEVWRAEHRLLARPAAIKLIQASALEAHGGESAENTLARFEREAQATALLTSEHTIELYDFGVSADGSPYYVMELLDGLDLEELVKRHGPLPPERAVHCLLQVCDSLAEAHAAGLIHRDIKPSNIFLCRRGLRYDHIKVLDFGLVKGAPAPDSAGSSTQLTSEHAISGTPAYLVPEIIEASSAIDGRADLYAIGCVAYWLLSGRLVFEASTPVTMVLCHLRDEPPRLSSRATQAIPPELEQVVHACLQKDPALRPQGALELKARLSAVPLDRAWTPDAAREWWQTFRQPTGTPPAVDPMGATLVEEAKTLEVARTSPTTVRERPLKRRD